MIIKKITKIIFIGFFLSFISSIAWANQLAAQQLSQQLKSYTTYQAIFRQSTYNSRGRRLQASSGQVILMRPNKFYWQVYAPNRQVVVSNGTYLWEYNVALAQVTRQYLEPHKHLTPAALLTGDFRQLTRNFRVERIPQRGALLFQLTALNKNSAFTSVMMQFVYHRLTWMRVMNNLGQTTVFSFSRIRANHRVNPQVFNFQVPRGVDLLKQRG